MVQNCYKCLTKIDTNNYEQTGCCQISPEQLEVARLEHGTDQDLLIIQRKKLQQHFEGQDRPLATSDWMKTSVVEQLKLR